MRLNRGVTSLAPSGIREIMSLAGGRDGVIRLDIGDPDFDVPEHVREAARRTSVGYAPSAGMADLRVAAARKVRRHNGFDADAEQVVVTQGATQGIFAALMALAETGDEVLIPDPAWPNYRMMTTALGLSAKPYRAGDGSFLPAVEELELLVTPRTRVLLINSPANPTGAVIPSGLMAELVDFAERKGLWVLSDECYDQIGDGTYVSAAACGSNSNVIAAYSLSKTYSMTGWRVGYLVAPVPVAHAIAKCQELLLACVGDPAQHAALAALTGPQDCVAQINERYRRRVDAVLSELDASVLLAVPPRGGFYVWVDVSRTGLDDREFALGLLDSEAVAVAPGSAFGPGGRGHIRLSLTTCAAEAVEGAARINRFASGRLGLSVATDAAGSGASGPRSEIR